MRDPAAKTEVASLTGMLRDADDVRVALERADIAARDGRVAGPLALVFVAVLYPLLDALPTVRASEDASFAWLCAALAVLVGNIALCAAWRHLRATRARGSGAGRLQDEHCRVRRFTVAYRVAALAFGLCWSALPFVVDDGARPSVVEIALAGAFVLAFVAYRATRVAFVCAALPIATALSFELAQAGGIAVALAIAWPVVAFLFARAQHADARAEIADIETRLRADSDARAHRSVYDAIPLGIVVAEDTQIVDCNRALATMLGYDHASDLIGKSVRVLMPDETAWLEARDLVHALRADPVQQSRVVRRRRRDGSVIELKGDASLVRAAEGKTRGPRLVAIYEDVRMRVATDRAHREAARLQQLVFESAGEGIAIVDRGVVEQANRALSDLVGRPVGGLAGMRFADLFDDADGWTAIETRFQTLGGLLKVERRVRRADGRAVPVNVSGRAVDWLEPPREPEATQRSIWIVADLTSQKAREEENWHHANHDMLTGLPNRRFLQDRLEQALALARRDGKRVAVLSLDLDGFKGVNDTYGHRFGDAVLEEIARRLPGSVRELDTVGRWGGDEFVVVLKEIESREVVEDMVRRVLARIEEPVVYRGSELSVGASIGIALYPDHGEEIETVLLAADLAMFESKSAGGHGWRFAPPAALSTRGKYRPALDAID